MLATIGFMTYYEEIAVWTNQKYLWYQNTLPGKRASIEGICKLYAFE